MKTQIIVMIIIVALVILLIMRRKQKEGFDFIKPYDPSQMYVPSVTDSDSGAPAKINTNYDRIIHPSEVCVYREPRDRVGLTNPYGIGFSQNLAINRDTYLDIYNMYENRLAKQCHPSIQGPICDYLERTNPLFKGVSTFRKKPFEPNKLGTKAAKSIAELKSGADPLDEIAFQDDGYYRPALVQGPPRKKEKFSDPNNQVPRADHVSVHKKRHFDAAMPGPTSPAKTVSSYDIDTPSDLAEYKHYPKILYPSEQDAYYLQRTTFAKNPYKLGFSKSSIVNRDTYRDNFDKYGRRQPALCNPSNLYPVLDHLRLTGGKTDRRTGSFENRLPRGVQNLTERFSGSGVPSVDTWDLKDPRLCTEKRVGCPRMTPKLPLKLYSKCYEHNRARLVNPVIDVDPYQYW